MRGSGWRSHHAGWGGLGRAGRTEDELAEDRRGPGAVEGDDRVGRPAEPPPGERRELSMKNRLHI